MNLQIGILDTTFGWEIVLRQIGVSFQQVHPETSLADFACLIVNQAVSEDAKQRITDYLNEGGVLITNTAACLNLFSAHSKKIKIKYVQSQPDSLFAEIGLIDFYHNFKILKDCEFSFLDSSLFLQTKKQGKGRVINLPFDLDELVLNRDSLRKKFPAFRKELPSEIVAKVSKGKIRKLIETVLKFAFEERRLPFVQLSPFPNAVQQLFLFRVDTDFCSAELAEKLYELCRKYHIHGTWFVDTVSHDRLTGIYSRMPDQEIGLHCHRHLVFTDYATNWENIENGLHDLQKNGIKVRGFAAPFGDWNENLAQVLAEKGFRYSSEFTLNYDDLPFYPVVKNHFSPVLQIPVHPVSSGRMRRSHFSEDEMWQYFKTHLENCLRSHDPILIYHHPSHGHLSVFERIFAFIEEKKIPSCTYDEFAEWWLKRHNLKFNCEFSENTLYCQTDEFPTDLFIKIYFAGKTAVCSWQDRIDFNDLNWQEEAAKSLPEDLTEIRKWHWRDAVYNHESKKGKRYHAHLSR